MSLVYYFLGTVYVRYFICIVDKAYSEFGMVFLVFIFVSQTYEYLKLNCDSLGGSTTLMTV